MKIAIAADHGGFELKGVIIDHLLKKGCEVINLGTDTADSVDYSDYAVKCADAVLNGGVDFGIVCCGTGIGISIAANKINGIRCALCHSPETAALAKQHNNANIISLGGRTTSGELALKIVDAYMDAEFEGGRHQRRVDKIMALEKR
ncbi:MAG: ribose 5-phosphate isomerase B [Clostridia bacterium]